MADAIELLERFRAGSDLVVEALADTLPEEIDFAPDLEAWSLRQIVAHIADCEVAAAWRFRKLIAEPGAVLDSFDQNRWAAELGYNRRHPSDSLKLFLALRADNYDQLLQLTAVDFQKWGTHPERGRVTLLDMLRINVEHAEKHAAQIRRVREQFRTAAPQDQPKSQ